MNENRTFGIEIECYAKYDKPIMADRIQSYLREAGFSSHRVEVGSYSHATNNNNTTLWKVESDGSLIPSSSIRENYPFPMEIKSPVLQGSTGIKKLKAVCDAIEGITTVNVRCGLHVHHGMQNMTEGESLHNLINAWIRFEDHFMKALPNSRQSNTYAKKWSVAGAYGRKPYIMPHETVREWYNSRIRDRRVTLNFESYWMRNTVEFRMHSGTVEFEKMKNWITVTQLFIDKALLGVYTNFPDSIDFDVFINSMKEDTAVRSSRRRRVVRRPSNGEYIHPDAKRKKMPRVGTKAHTIVRLLLQENGASKSELKQELDARHGSMASGKQAKLIAGQLTNMKTTKWGYGFNIVKGADNRFRLLPMADVFEEQEEVDDSDVRLVALTEDEKAAVDWFVSRCEYFKTRRSDTAPRPQRERPHRVPYVDDYQEAARSWMGRIND